MDVEHAGRGKLIVEELMFLTVHLLHRERLQHELLQLDHREIAELGGGDLREVELARAHGVISALACTGFALMSSRQ